MIGKMPLTYAEAKSEFSKYRNKKRKTILGSLGKYVIFWFDIINGLWSGFPLCCVWYFSKMELQGAKYPNAIHAFMECVHNDEDYWFWVGQSQYVLCPKCFEARHHLPRCKLRSGGVSIMWLQGGEPWTMLLKNCCGMLTGASIVTTLLKSITMIRAIGRAVTTPSE